MQTGNFLSEHKIKKSDTKHFYTKGGGWQQMPTKGDGPFVVPQMNHFWGEIVDPSGEERYYVVVEKKRLHMLASTNPPPLFDHKLEV